MTQMREELPYLFIAVQDGRGVAGRTVMISAHRIFLDRTLSNASTTSQQNEQCRYQTQ